jgi:hypothetical protein
MYKEYGTKTGLYFSPGEIAEMEAQVAVAKKTQAGLFQRAEFQNISTANLTPEERQGLNAHRKLTRSKGLRDTANYDANLNQADAERKPETVRARKMFFRAERLRRFENPEQAYDLYQEVWPLWTQVLLSHPEFARLFHIQEEGYDFSLHWRILAQEQRPQVFKAACLDLAQAMNWSVARATAPGLYPGNLWLAAPALFNPELQHTLLPIRNTRGQLEWTMYYAGGGEQLKQALASWTQGAGLGMRLPNPHAFHLPLVGTLARDAQTPEGWQPLIEPSTVEIVRGRTRPAQPTAKKE